VGRIRVLGLVVSDAQIQFFIKISVRIALVILILAFGFGLRNWPLMLAVLLIIPLFTSFQTGSL
jgi:hypothetical protein